MNGTLWSLEQTVVKLNGLTLSGWSNDADAFAAPPEVEIGKAVFGADGKMILTATGQKGGPVPFKFLANSSSVKFLQNLVTQWQTTGAMTIFNCVALYNTGVMTTFTNGGFTKVPLAPTIGMGETKNMVYEITFEKIISEYLTAQF